MTQAARVSSNAPPITRAKRYSTAELAALARIQQRLRELGALTVNFHGDLIQHPRRYMNATVPMPRDGTEPRTEGVCCKCGHAYAELVGSMKAQCSECRGEAVAEHSERLQYEIGIDLGWHSRDTVSERMIYGFYDPIPVGQYTNLVRTVDGVLWRTSGWYDDPEPAKKEPRTDPLDDRTYYEQWDEVRKSLGGGNERAK